MPVSTAARPASLPTAGADRRARRTVGLVLLAATTAVAGFATWFSHPTGVVAGRGATIGMELVVGATGLVDAGVSARRVGDDPLDVVPVTLLAAVPIVVENTASADVDLVLCRGGRVGAVRLTDGGQLCGAMIQLADADQPLTGDDQVLVRITPHRAGTVRVEGIDLIYREGVRRASVRTGSTVITTT